MSNDVEARLAFEPLVSRSLVVASYGGRLNSTALLVRWVEGGNPLDLVLFADTGGEKPHTYAYIPMFSDWLQAHGAPGVVTVSATQTLESRCLKNRMLPSIAYGRKACSERHKARPQNRYMKNWQPAQSQWKEGRKIIKLIGYDADEPHRAKDYEDNKYIYKYPLIEWGMTREDCAKAIKAAGLCVPGKSACFYCPSSTAAEIRALAAQYPELAQRALTMESGAHLTTIKGLGRRFAWRDLLATGDMLEDLFDAYAPDVTCGCYDG